MQAVIDWSKFLPVIVGVIALIIGMAIGYFDSNNRAAKKIAQAEQKAEIAVAQAKGDAERAINTAQAARAAAEAKPSLPGSTLLRLWLDVNANPQLDLDNRRVEVAPLAELSRKRLLVLLNMMRPWIEGKAAAPVAPAPAASASPSAPEPRLMPLQMTPPPPAPEQPAAPVVAVKKDEKPAAPTTIVGQIDEILQGMLALTTLAKRGIRLTESPEGGVVVWVGLTKFAGVGEVTDPEVKAVIQAAIRAWEKKYTPGL
ncbi:MAG: hypothetical protein HY867_01525 [Chloroflexi bacterium]|nr:hypothetical protein [Chloroflexota bacterium]